MIRSIGDILEALPVNARVKEYGLLKDWDRLVGPQIAKQCQPEKLKDGILYLKVSSSAWMQQLHFMQGMILEKIRSHTEGGSVKELRFSIGKVVLLRKSSAKPWMNVNLTSHDMSRIEDDLSSVTDTELKDVMKKILLKQAQLKSWRDQKKI